MNNIKDRRHCLLDYTGFTYNIKTIMLSVTVFGDFFFMCDMLYHENISLGKYLSIYSYISGNKPRTLHSIASKGKSIRSVRISNKKDIHNSSCALHKLSDFK